tara:strand:+ start:339 stop:626 length:288 start_codon:yes stop_codon:yes gene_type:complete
MAYSQSPMNFGIGTGSSPLNKNGKDKHPPASHHEKKKNTYVTEDDSNREKINDLEDRIEFLQSDMAEAKAPAKKASLRNQIAKLRDQLAKLQKQG